MTVIPRHAVTGRLVDPSTGRPLAGARVRFTPQLPDGALRAAGAVGIPAVVEAVTDEDGRVSVMLAQSAGAVGVSPQGWAWLMTTTLPDQTQRDMLVIVDGPVELGSAVTTPNRGPHAGYLEAARRAEEAARRAELAAGAGPSGSMSARPDPADGGALIISAGTAARPDPEDPGVLIIGG